MFETALLSASGWVSDTPGRLMAAVTHVCTIEYVAKMLSEDAEFLEAIIYNDDNLTIYYNAGHPYVAVSATCVDSRVDPSS